MFKLMIASTIGITLLYDSLTLNEEIYFLKTVKDLLFDLLYSKFINMWNRWLYFVSLLVSNVLKSFIYIIEECT